MYIYELRNICEIQGFMCIVSIIFLDFCEQSGYSTRHMEPLGPLQVN